MGKERISNCCCSVSVATQTRSPSSKSSRSGLTLTSACLSPMLLPHPDHMEGGWTMTSAKLQPIPHLSSINLFARLAKAKEGCPSYRCFLKTTRGHPFYKIPTPKDTCPIDSSLNCLNLIELDLENKSGINPR